MNERIKSLMLEAGYAAPELASRANKLAELIVKECAQVCINLQDIPATEPKHCAEDIKIHFGVNP